MGNINKKPNVSVVVVNHNGKKYLKRCFAALYKLNYPKNRLEIIMVDNCSTDGSIGYIRRNFPKIKIIKNTVNNYCKANNLGIKHAGSKYIALLNNDTKVDKEWLIELIETMKSKESIGAVGSKILLMDGSVESTGHQELPDFYWSDKTATKKDRGRPRASKEVNTVCGCAVLYCRDALKDVGGFDEDFNMYLDDVDISIRLRKKHWKVMYASKSLVYHIHHGTAREDSPQFFTERNRLLLVAKYYPEKLGSALLGRGYFTAQRGIEAQAGLYKILDDIILKLVKHHTIGIVRGILKEVFEELRKISNYENVVLKNKVEHFLESIASYEDIVKEKDKHVGSLNIEVARRDEAIKQKDGHVDSLNKAIKEKDTYVTSLNKEVKNRDNALKEKDKHVGSLNIEVARRDEAIKEKDTYVNGLNKELHSKDDALAKKDRYVNDLNLEIDKRARDITAKDIHLKDLKREIDNKEQVIKDIYDSTAFKFLVTPIWAFLWKIKQGLKKVTKKESIAKEVKDSVVDHHNKTDTGNLAICTIISKNYLAYARILTESFLKYNKGHVFVLLTDKVDGYFDPKKERFTLIEINDIKDRVNNFEQFCFQYDPTELNTAIKPFFLEFLFEKYKLQKLVFFDPDVLITNKLDDLFGMLDRFSIVLIPHITRPFPDTKKPAEIEILRSGVYNLGFIALSHKDSTKVLIKWWKERLRRYCTIDPEKGLFVDQKWIDLIPGFFEDVFILRDEGYNIAYWNFHYRKAYLDRDRILVNSTPSHFIHFSGFDPDNMDPVSRHQDRFRVKDLLHMEPIFKLYRDKLISNGYGDSKGWPCVFNYFDNGAKITSVIRRIYWEVKNSDIMFGNPFTISDKRSYFNWLNQKIDTKTPDITRLMYGTYKKRPDVERVYPDIFDSDREAFVKWFLTSGKREHDIDDRFLQGRIFFKARNKSIAWINLRTKIIYSFRNSLKIFFKKLFRNNLWAINNLKATERRLSRKIRDIKILKPGNSNGMGVNVLGYLTAELGVGEGARANVKCLKSANIKFSLLNIDSHANSRKLDPSFSEFSEHNPYPINLIHVNADMFSRVYMEKGTNTFKDKYNIGFWTWELSDFPEEWFESFRFCDEIWVPSNFVLEAISKKSPIPVLKIPHAVMLNGTKDASRSYFGFKDNEFIFLFIFDFFSYFERKNPLTIIKAFRQAFPASENVRLVIKCSNSSYDPPALNRLKEAARGLNIDIIDRYLYRDEVNSLISLCDSYVSLHRSEGFGLTMAEAMYLGKPVIATGFSGNTDFMNMSNSYLVKYRLIAIDKDVGPYKSGCLWADPDIEHAVETMRYVFNNKSESKKIGKIASVDIQKNLNYNVIGNKIKERVCCIGKNYKIK